MSQILLSADYPEKRIILVSTSLCRKSTAHPVSRLISTIQSFVTVILRLRVVCGLSLLSVGSRPYSEGFCSASTLQIPIRSGNEGLSFINDDIFYFFFHIER